MAVVDVVKDPATLSLQVTTDFEAPVDRVWQLWGDPRQLERWWGPPTHPATVVDHELVPGGRVTYFMTGPGGERYHGWWEVLAVSAPHSLDVRDGFADEHGTPDSELPVTSMRVELSEADGRTRAVVTSVFPSTEAMEQLITMGMEEGLRAAMGQMDVVLADGR